MKRFSFARICSILFVVVVLALVPAGSSSAAQPAKVKNFRLVCNGNKSAFLAWDKAKNASYYLIYSYDAASGKYTKLEKTTARSCQVKKLKDGQTYQLVIQSVNTHKKKTTKSAYSAPLTVVGRTIKLNVHGRRWSVRTKREITGKDLDTKKTVKIKKGMTGTTAGKKTTVKFKNGAKIKVKKRDVTYTNLAVYKSYDYYTQEQAEAFVNTKGYSSKTKWLVWISQYTGSVHIFKGARGSWKRMRIAKCVIGKGGKTSLGVFRMLRRSSTHGKPQIYFSWNSAKQWGQSFHCRIDKNTHGAYSSGCIRLGDKDLNYLVKHCPMGTTVVSY